MDPLVEFITAHAREQWASNVVRVNFEATFGIPRDGTNRPPDTIWRSAVSRAFSLERRRTALELAHGNALVATALRGVMAGTGPVNVRHLVVGTDVGGSVVRSVVDVIVPRSARIRDIPALAAEAARQGPSAAGAQIHTVVMIDVLHAE